MPEQLTEQKANPRSSADKKKDSPKRTTQPKETPKTKSKAKEIPETSGAINCVKVGESLIEIKPTKLKYQRNRTALFYKILDIFFLFLHMLFRRQKTCS